VLKGKRTRAQAQASVANGKRGGAPKGYKNPAAAANALKAAAATTYKPTKANITTVQNLVLLGAKEPIIAQCVGVNIDTLRKHFHYELTQYREDMLGKVAQSAFTAALNGDKTMMIFVLKCRAGWRETDAIDLSGKVEIIKRVVGVDENDV